MAVHRNRRRYRRKRVRRIRRWIAFGILCLLFLGILWKGSTFLWPLHGIDETTTSIDGIPLYTDFLDPQWRGRTGELRQIRWLVIHETGNTEAGADAAMHNRYLHSKEQKEIPLSWHYTVDDHQIYHHLPDAERGYHASDSSVKGGGNECGIGIEICVNADGDYDKAVDNAAHLAARLLKQYHLTISDVKQHGDFTSKNCPERLRQGDRYAQFLEKIKQYM